MYFKWLLKEQIEDKWNIASVTYYYNSLTIASICIYSNGCGYHVFGIYYRRSIMEPEKAIEKLTRLQLLAAEIAAAIQPDMERNVSGDSATPMLPKMCDSGFYCGKYNCSPPFSCSDFGCSSGFSFG